MRARVPGFARWREHCAAMAALLLLAASPARGYRTEKVVIVVIDGPRMSESFEELDHPHIPGIWGQLRPAGSLIPEFQNQGSTYTMRGHASLLTGTWQNIANDGSERPTQPTLFEYYRASTGAPAHDAWLIAGKEKLNACTYSSHSDYGSAYGASGNNANRRDIETYALFKLILANIRPTLSLLSLSETDILGHYADWNGYLSAIARADSIITDLWTWIETDGSYAGRTTLILTYDHGRHLDEAGGFQQHGDACAGCVRIGFVAVGPDIVSGGVSKSVRNLRDICSTVAVLLGFDAPLSEGEVLEELLSDPIAVDEDPGVAGLEVITELDAFPNPFNPSIRIVIRLARAGVLALDVDDVQGRRVRRLAAGRLPPGAHPFLWDGRDSGARPVASGVYYLVARSGEERERRKITLLR